MLINLSNHPHAQWSDAQREAALTQFEQIEDLPFPAVSPQASPAEVEQLAAQLLAQCQQLAAPHCHAAVMIAGEQTLVFHTVRLLKASAIPCYAATSERKVVQKSATEKSIEFSFVQFRAF